MKMFPPFRKTLLSNYACNEKHQIVWIKECHANVFADEYLEKAQRLVVFGSKKYTLDCKNVMRKQ